MYQCSLTLKLFFLLNLNKSIQILAWLQIEFLSQYSFYINILQFSIPIWLLSLLFETLILSKGKLFFFLLPKKHHKTSCPSYLSLAKQHILFFLLIFVYIHFFLTLIISSSFGKTNHSSFINQVCQGDFYSSLFQKAFPSPPHFFFWSVSVGNVLVISWGVYIRRYDKIHNFKEQKKNLSFLLGISG